MGAPPQLDTHAQVTFDRLLREQAQQATTKLRGAVRGETLDGEKKYFDYYGVGTLNERLTRGQANTPQEMPRIRRAITPRDFEYTEEFDLQKDQVRLREAVIPNSGLQKAIHKSLKRQIDDLIIEAFHADALGGKEGNELVPFAAGQTLEVQVGALTQGGIRTARQIFLRNGLRRNDVISLAVHPNQLDDMLEDGNREVSSIDYNTKRAIINGEFDFWLGVHWIQTTRVQPGDHGATETWATFFTHRSMAFAIDPGSLETQWEKIPGRGKVWQFTVTASMAASRIFDFEVFRVDI